METKIYFGENAKEQMYLEELAEYKKISAERFGHEKIYAHFRMA